MMIQYSSKTCSKGQREKGRGGGGWREGVAGRKGGKEREREREGGGEGEREREKERERERERETDRQTDRQTDRDRETELGQQNRDKSLGQFSNSLALTGHSPSSSSSYTKQWQGTTLTPGSWKTAGSKGHSPGGGPQRGPPDRSSYAVTAPVWSQGPLGPACHRTSPPLGTAVPWLHSQRTSE